MTLPTGLEGKVALVTGGSGAIGSATCRALARRGATVIAAELSGFATSARQLVDGINACGGKAFDVALDVTATHAIAGMIDLIAAQHGTIDILVNNAGVQSIRPAFEVDEEQFDHVLSVNLKGAFFCSQAVAESMVSSGGGAIVFVGSQHGVVGNRNRAAYCASKAGVINLARALALEWAEYNIRVNCISPTFVKHEKNAALLHDDFIASDIARIPLGRPITPEEVADGICFLASDQSSGMTGTNMMVDGGWTAQ